MNLDIMEYSEQTGEVYWRLNGQDGVCEVVDGKVDSVYLCDGPFDLLPDAIRYVVDSLQQWLDDIPKREAENKEWEDEYVNYFGDNGVWQEWEKTNKLRCAIPSIYHEPSEIAIVGEVRFVMFSYPSPYRSLLYNNPTWGDIVLEFDKAIEHCKDFDHCYLEGIEPSGIPGEFEFLAGS